MQRMKNRYMDTRATHDLFEQNVAHATEELLNLRQKIAETNKVYNDYITIASEDFITEQVEQAAQKKTPLAGVPVAIKDNIAVKELKMTCGSKMLEDFEQPLYDATVITKLKEAGAIIVGKTNLDEFAMGGSNETSYYGPVKNPYNLDYVSGGSSGGSAVAVANGYVNMALGTDTGGSVRQPAAFNNIVGMKPTYGRISRFGVTAFSSSLDQVGIFTRTVEENALFLKYLAGADSFDTTSSKVPVPDYEALLHTDMKGKKIAIFEEFLAEGIHPEVLEKTKETMRIFEEMGAIVEIVSLTHLKYVIAAYYIIAPSEASSNLARFDGLHYGYRSPHAKTIEEIYTMSRTEGFGSEVKRRIMLGTYFLNHDAYDSFYIQAAKLRRLIEQDFAQIFASYDIVLGPTVPSPPFKLGENLSDPLAMYLIDLCTIPANLIGLPAISVPGGFTKDGLPIGMQFIAKSFDEVTLFQFAYALEQKTKYYQKTPKTVD